MQPNQKFTDKQFIELYNRNLNDQQIADILNVSRTITRNRRWKLKLMPQQPHYNSNPEFNYQNLKKLLNEREIRRKLKDPKKFLLKRRTSGKKWRKNNPEKNRAHVKRWREENKEKNYARQLKWRKENPKKWKQIQQRYNKKRKKTVKITNSTPIIRKQEN